MSARDTAILAMTAADVARFWSKVNKEPGQGSGGECWEWAAARDGHGYGQFGIRHNGKDVAVFASRVVFFLDNGVLPNPNALHECDNPPCCRGSHLFDGTQQDNMKDMDRKSRRVIGEGRSQAKITDAIASEMRRVHAETDASWAELGRQFGVHRETARKCVQRLTWRHVP